MTPAEVLRAAREKIATPERWTKGAGARDADGVEVDPADERAVCFCAEGSVIAVIYAANLEFDAYCDVRGYLDRALGIGGILGRAHVFNDAKASTHADVLALFDRAIAAAEGK